MSSDPRADAAAAFSAEGLVPQTWANQPGHTYSAHQHPYHKVLFCVEGSITFHLDNGDVQLVAGDRLDLEPGTRHGATVGDDGVTCMEAARD